MPMNAVPYASIIKRNLANPVRVWLKYPVTMVGKEVIVLASRATVGLDLMHRPSLKVLVYCLLIHEDSGQLM